MGKLVTGLFHWLFGHWWKETKTSSPPTRRCSICGIKQSWWYGDWWNEGEYSAFLRKRAELIEKYGPIKFD